MDAQRPLERWETVERRFEIPRLIAALLVIPAIVIESSDTGEPWGTDAVVLNWTIWLAFLIELVVLLRLVPDKGRWLRDHPLDVAIVVLTPPFLPTSLQAARVFRLVRLFKLASLTRPLLSTEGLRDAAVLAVLTVLGGGAAFAAVEKGPDGEALTAWDGVWWAMTTVTTVGYGDLSPTTDGGRVIAMVVMVVGIGFIALLTAAAADRFMRSRGADERRAEDHLAEISARLSALEERGR